MLRTYIRAEMLAIWRRALGMEPSNIGVDIETFEGIDCSTQILDRMRKWYLNLLDTGPVDKLAIETVALTPLLTGKSVLARAKVPDKTRRVLWVESSNWQRGMEPLSPEAAASRLERLASPYGRPTSEEPLAVATPGFIELAPWTGDTATARIIADPGPDIYILDDSLLPDFEA